MRLTKLKDYVKQINLTPEAISKLSGGDFSNMTVRRAMAGEDIDQLKAKAIAKALNVSLETLQL